MGQVRKNPDVSDSFSSIRSVGKGKNGFSENRTPRGSLRPGAGLVLCTLWLFGLPGCATNKDLQRLRTEVEQDLSTVKQDLQGVRTELRGLSARQEEKLAQVRSDVHASLERLREQVTALGKLREDLENVRADVALLKPLGMVLDSVQERLEATHGVIEKLKAEAQTHQAAIAKLEGNIQDVQALQEEIAKETQRVEAVIGEIGEGIIERLRMEMTFAKDRIQQLEQVLNQFPVGKDRENTKAAISPTPG